MKNARETSRTCGMDGGPKPAVAACGCGVASARPGNTRSGAGFSIKPTRPGHRRSLDCALRMGHCAPAVMAALTGDNDPGRDSAVLLASAMAGGIGNSGRECGALTSSILHLGERYGRAAGPNGVALSVILSQRFIERFREVHNGNRCDEIRRGGKNPLPCMRAMVSAPELFNGITAHGGAIDSEDTRVGAGAKLLLSAFEARSFHCVHSVFAGLSGIVPECGRLREMTYPLVGGFALSGGTCSAAAAGVIAIGLATGQIENSYIRVAAMMARMLSGGDMMADSVNNFNPAIKRGQVLMEWFDRTYGTASCTELTGLTLRESDKAGRYFSGGGIEQCEAMAAAVATKAREIIEGARQ